MKSLIIFRISWLLAIVSILTSCQDEDTLSLEQGEYLIFGSFYGECIGEGCVTIYKIENNQLFIDEDENYPTNQRPYEGKFTALSATSYDQVKALPSALPDELWEEPYLIGCPDCYDQGGLYIEIQVGDKYKSWAIDQSRNDVPDYLQGFHQLVNQKLSELQ